MGWCQHSVVLFHVWHLGPILSTDIQFIVYYSFVIPLLHFVLLSEKQIATAHVTFFLLAIITLVSGNNPKK